MMSTASLLEHALDYVADGYEIFPVNRNKAPLTKHGMKDATTDTDQIQAWWGARPGALIGCRIPKNRVLLDIDPRHGGMTTWAALLDRFGPLTSRCHYSGRGDGGFHIWLRPPAGTQGRWSVGALNRWAQEHDVGSPILDAEGNDSGHWTAGIDLLHRGHRYTILPP